MKNCLVTKLNSIVNNSGLKKLGVLRFEVNVNSIDRKNNIHCNTLNHCKFTIVSGPEGGQLVKVGASEALDVPLGTEFFLNNSSDLYYFSKPGKYVIEITNKYDIKTFGFYHHVSISLDDMMYLNTLSYVRLSGENIIGNFNNLLNSNITYMYISNYTKSFLPAENVVGDIAEIANISINSFILDGCDGITGDLSSLSSHSTLSTLAINHSHKVTGKISDITSISNLSNFQCADSQLITGSLADFLDNGQLLNPKLSILVVNKTPNIVKNQEDITTLRNLGVQVTV